jgi:hypothetical protein
MDEVASKVEPAAVEFDVQGEISGVRVRGRVDVLDVEGRLIDFKTASRRPSYVSADYAFQLATYQQTTPGASGEVRIDSLVKTQTVQIVQQAYTVEEPDIRATQVLVSDGAEGHGNRDVLSEPAVHALQPEALQLLAALRRGVRRAGPALLILTTTP